MNNKKSKKNEKNDKNNEKDNWPMGKDGCPHERKIKIAKKTGEVIKAYSSNASSNCDPFGSYTGTPDEKFEKPIQDADDL